MRIYNDLEEAIQKLPPRYEQVIRLRNELKLSFAEVGNRHELFARRRPEAVDTGREPIVPSI